MGALEPLFSGSSGNAILIKSETHSLLVDAGVSGRRIVSALSASKRPIEAVDGIFVTHEHIDHIKSVGSLARRYSIPVYANVNTWEAMSPVIGELPSSLIKTVETEKSVFVGDIEVTPFSVSHDAVNPYLYTFCTGKRKVTVATDIGKMTDKVFLAISGSDEILLESNYDIVMLRKGKYPLSLQRRIAGDKGHLSNKEAAAVCARLASLGTKRIVLGHLSKENNTPELAYCIAKHYIEECGITVGRDIRLSVAPRG